MNKTTMNICTEMMILAACVEFDTLTDSIKDKIRANFKPFDNGTLSTANTMLYIRKENDRIWNTGIGYQFELEYFYPNCECPEGTTFYLELDSEEKEFIDNLIIETIRYSLEHINDNRQ